jgi:AAA domain
MNENFDLTHRLAKEYAEREKEQDSQAQLKILESVLPPLYRWNEFELLPVEKPQEIVAGFIDAGQIVAGGGTSKAGKTFLALQLAVSVAAGVTFLGAFNPSPVAVLYVGFELSDYRLKQRISAIAKRIGASPGANLFVWNLRRKYLDITDFAQLLSLKIKQCAVLLVIVDPLYTLLGNRDENRVTDMTDLLVQLAKVQDRTAGKIAIILMHHFPKGLHAGQSLLDCFSGSSALGRFVDSAFGIRDHKSTNAEAKSYVLDFELRDHPAIPGFVVDLEFPVFLRNDAKDPAQYKEAGGRPKEFSAEELLNHLAKHDDEFSTTAAWAQCWQEDTTASRSTFYQLFGELKAARQIFRSKTTGKWQVVADCL